MFNAEPYSTNSMQTHVPFSLTNEFISVGIETKRWFMALALADFVDSRLLATEARECGLVGETQMKVRAYEMATLLYARPFIGCTTPSGRTTLKLPTRVLAQLGWGRVAVHGRALACRDRFTAYGNLEESRLAFCISSNAQGLDFGAALTRPAPRDSDIEDLIEIIDGLIFAIKSELADIVTHDRRLAVSLFGTEVLLNPAADD